MAKKWIRGRGKMRSARLVHHLSLEINIFDVRIELAEVFGWICMRTGIFRRKQKTNKFCEQSEAEHILDVRGGDKIITNASETHKHIYAQSVRKRAFMTLNTSHRHDRLRAGSQVPKIIYFLKRVISMLCFFCSQVECGEATVANNTRQMQQ